MIPPLILVGLWLGLGLRRHLVAMVSTVVVGSLALAVVLWDVGTYATSSSDTARVERGGEWYGSWGLYLGNLAVGLAVALPFGRAFSRLRDRRRRPTDRG